VTKITAVPNMTLATPKVRAKHELLFCKPASEVDLLNILSLTQVSKQSVTNIISVTIVNLVMPKGNAKHEPLFYKPGIRGGLVEHPKSDTSSTTKCDQNHISHFFINLITSKV
jgi:hypothetical protein